jgi:flagellin-like protein
MKKRDRKGILFRRRRGMSNIVATVLIILIVVAAVMLVWLAIIPWIQGFFDIQEKKMELQQENILIVDIGSRNPASQFVNLTISRGSTALVDVELETIYEEVIVTEPIPFDIVLLFDVSGSMIDEYYDYDGDGVDDSRFMVAKNITKNFVNSILSKNANLRIGAIAIHHYTLDSGLDLKNVVVDYPVDHSYDISWKEDDIRNFSLDFSSDSVEINTFIDQLIYDSYWGVNTNLSSAILRADHEFNDFFREEKEGLQKIFILLGDGGKIPYDTAHVANIAEEINNSKDIIFNTILFGNTGSGPIFNSIVDSGGGRNYTANDAGELASSFESIASSAEVTREEKTIIPLEGTFLEIIFHAGGNSFTHTIVEEIPGSNEQRRYKVPLQNNLLWEDITRVDVYLSAITSSGNQVSVLMSRWKA